MKSNRISATRIVIIVFALAGLIVLPLLWITFGPRDDSGSSFERIFDGPYNPNEYFLEFERTPCFGECPVFVLRIGKNGIASLDVPGDRPFSEESKTPNIKHIRYSKAVSASSRLELVQTLEKGGFWKLDSDYSFMVTDNPGKQISVQSKDRSWSVHVYAVPCVTQAKSFSSTYLENRKYEKLVPDVFCDLETKLDAIACDIYKNGHTSPDDNTKAIWPPSCAPA